MSETAVNESSNSTQHSTQTSYAGFWERFLAFVIDSLILLIPSLLLASASLGILGGFIMGLLYRPVFESSFLEATIGKRVMGLRVVNREYSRITFRAAVIRWAVSWVSALFLFLGHLIQPFTKQKQTVADLIAETYVINGRVELPIEKTVFDCWLDQIKKLIGK